MAWILTTRLLLNAPAGSAIDLVVAEKGAGQTFNGPFASGDDVIRLATEAPPRGVVVAIGTAALVRAPKR